MNRFLRVIRQRLVIVLALVPVSLDAQEHLFAVDSIGSATGDDSFGVIVDIALSSEGALAVSQYNLGEIWVFDAMGNKRVVGRRGEGPGEFGFVSSVAWRKDTLVVVEGRRHRVSLMAEDGRYLKSYTTISSLARISHTSAF